MSNTVLKMKCKPLAAIKVALSYFKGHPHTHIPFFAEMLCIKQVEEAGHVCKLEV